MQNVTVIDHPIIRRYLTYLRDKDTNTALFRRSMSNIGIILAYKALNDLPLRSTRILTPIQETEGFEPATDVVVIPILRAGLSLVDGIINFMPEAKVGHVGVYRDEETHKPINYYDNLPDGTKDAYNLVVDPMLATGGSASHAISFLKDHGATNIRFVCVIASPEGIHRLNEDHPDIQVITAAVDEKLNDEAFIVPGLGDAGDRYFGTI